MAIVMGVMMVAMVAFMWGSHKDRHGTMGGHNNESVVEEKTKAPEQNQKRAEEPKKEMEKEKPADNVEKI